MYLNVNVRVRGMQEGGGRVDDAGGHMQGAAPVCSNYNSISYDHNHYNYYHKYYHNYDYNNPSDR